MTALIKSLVLAATLGAAVAAVPAASDTPTGAKDRTQRVLRGDPAAAQAAFRSYGCVACHRIPNVPGARGRAGPPLENFAGRRFIAGGVPNTPEALVTFIMEPQTLRPGIAMPDLDVSEKDARDMAAYLLSLE